MKTNVVELNHIMLLVGSRTNHGQRSNDVFVRQALKSFCSEAEDRSQQIPKNTISEAELSAWEIARTERGKPYFVRHPEIHYSVSDSGNLAACAFSPEEIGIDLQLHDRNRQPTSVPDREQQLSRLQRIARRACHPDECAWLGDSGQTDEAIRRFFQIWTAKEAFVKFTGRGIDDSFPKFSVLDAAGNIPAFPRDEFCSWEANGAVFYGQEIGEQCSLCICSPRDLKIELHKDLPVTVR